MLTLELARNASSCEWRTRLDGVGAFTSITLDLVTYRTYLVREW